MKRDAMTDSTLAENPYALLWDKIQHLRFAMLTTIDPDGELSSRPMTMAQKDFDGDLWFFTSIKSHPAIAVAHHEDVLLNFVDPSKDLYVSVRGHAILDNHPARLEEHWNPLVKAWFPQGIDDPDLTLIRVTADLAEYWDVKESKIVQMFKMARAAVTGERPTDLGEHAKLKL